MNAQYAGGDNRFEWLCTLQIGFYETIVAVMSSDCGSGASSTAAVDDNLRRSKPARFGVIVTNYHSYPQRRDFNCIFVDCIDTVQCLVTSLQ
jgi:hypothetical protein